MIHLEQHGAVTAIRMARAFFGRPVYWTAAYWVDGLLIDSGPPCTSHELVKAMRNRRVEQIVITHAHEDHYGGLARLHRAFPDAAMYAPRRALPIIAEPKSWNVPLYRLALWGRPQSVPDVRSLDDVYDCITTASYTFRVVETPGHSPDHISLFEPAQRWLFAGDAFIGGEDRAWAARSDLFGTVSSLRSMAALRPERMFPGSGSVRRTALPDLHAKIGYYSRLTDAVAKGDAAGANTAELVSILLGGESRMRFWTGGDYTAANLIEACREYNALRGSSSYEESDEWLETTEGEAENPSSPQAPRSTDLTI
jgi:glyoxylase-like metal-dependent hydrolase (beta-lactamase superfamily II)